MFLVCLAIGVGAIAAVSSLSETIQLGLRTDARALLGGDAELRLTYRPIIADEAAFLAATTEALATNIVMRTMAEAGDKRTLVELKAVGGAYPLYGGIVLEPAMSLDAALARLAGVPGAVVEEAAFDRLQLRIGDQARIGDVTFDIRAVIRREPDRVAGPIAFGPRLMIADSELAATGLVQPGSLIRYHYKVRLAEGSNVDRWISQAQGAFSEAAARVTSYREAAPGLRRTVERLAVFLNLVGLSALLVGGIGVANAVQSYMAGKTVTIATFKCLGAPARLVFATYLTQIMALASLGIALGLAVGAAAPLALARLIEGLLPIQIEARLFPGALLLAGLFGALTALVFALWPLLRARDMAAASLFRDLIVPARRWPRVVDALMVLPPGLVLVALLIATSGDRRFALWFVAGSAATLLLFLGAASALTWLARVAGGPRLRVQALRLALANLSRPGASTVSVMLSLGFGVTILVTVALVEANLSGHVLERIPAAAPSHFFIDIQPDQAAGFADAVGSVAGARVIDTLPHIRGRISRINGVPASEAAVAPDARWALRDERGLTYAATPPARTHLVAGHWWPADYRGPPLVSFDAALARGFGLRVGDRLALNILGREIEAEIANLREIYWGDLQMQFAIVFAPGTLEAAPQTFIATTQAPPAGEEAVVRAVGHRFPNVSAIRVRDALDAVERILSQIANAVRATAAITLAAGAAVLAGAIAAGQRRRVYDAVILKVLGATRRDVLTAYLLEFLLLGAAAATIGGAAGTLSAYAILAHVIEVPWSFLPAAMAGAIMACLGVTLVFGGAGVWRALSQKAAPLLRHP